MEEQGVTSRTVSTTCGGPHSTAPRPSWRSTKAVRFPPYYKALNAAGWQRAASSSCQSSTQGTSGESCTSFGLTPSPINSYSLNAIKTAGRPHHHAKAMEMDWTLHEERAGQHHSHSPSLDTWRRQSSRPCILHLEYTRKLAQNPQTWWSFVATLRATQHKGHKWVWVGKHLGNPLRNEALSTGLNLSIDGHNILVLHLDQIHLLHC